MKLLGIMSGGNTDPSKGGWVGGRACRTIVRIWVPPGAHPRSVSPILRYFSLLSASVLIEVTPLHLIF